MVSSKLRETPRTRRISIVGGGIRQDSHHSAGIFTELASVSFLFFFARFAIVSRDFVFGRAHICASRLKFF
jgi:hypothetical protein